MRKAIFTVVFAATAVVLTASAAFAGGTYPPVPPSRTVTPVPGTPTAFTGGDIGTPLKVMVGLVALALIAFVALMFTKRAAD